MTTLQTADGRLLRARPAGAGYPAVTPGIGPFPPMWSDGERSTADADDHLVSYASLYRKQPVIAGVVDKLARRIATLPFDGYRRIGQEDERELQRGDSLDSLLRRPMPRCGTVHLLAQVAQSLLVNGNALVAKVRGTDPQAPPIMLWPLDWAKVSAYAQPGGQIEWWSTIQFGAQERFLAAADTMLFAWPSPCGGEIGVSPLEKLGVTIRLEDAAQRHQTASFRNGNRPSMAITLEGDVHKDTIDLVRARIDAMHKGVDQNAKTLFLAGGAKVTPLSLSPVEAALIQQRKLNREEVGMVYDLAGPLMNDLEHGTYSNVTELQRGLYRDVLPPWLSLIQETFQAQLLDLEAGWMDRFVEFDLSDKLKGDPVQLAQTLKLQVEAGLITRNEARRILNLPPSPDAAADQLTVNANNQAPIGAMQTGGPTPPNSGL